MTAQSDICIFGCAYDPTGMSLQHFRGVSSWCLFFVVASRQKMSVLVLLLIPQSILSQFQFT